METSPTDHPHTEIPVSNLPMWTPWVVVDVPSNDNIPAGRAVRLGNAMTKRNAWAVARREMDTRPEVVAMAVRRDGEAF